jgi:hypothetical protein
MFHFLVTHVIFAYEKKKKKAEQHANVLANISVAKQILDERKIKRQLSSQNIVKYESDLQYYSQEQQIHRERLKSDPLIKKELEQWFNVLLLLLQKHACCQTFS